MAPKVISVTHTPITRQGVNTQVREIPLFPADTYIFAWVYIHSFDSIYIHRETNMNASMPVHIYCIAALKLLTSHNTTTNKCLKKKSKVN